MATVSSTHTLPSGWTVSQSSTSSTPSCTDAVPGKNGHVSDASACNAYWSYDPSFGAAILFCVLFGLLSIAHITQAFLFKKRYTWVIIVGAVWELISFVTRTLGTRRQQSLALVVVSQLFLLLAPLWVNAFAYMTLGRMIHFFHPTRRVFGIQASKITKYFVWGDVVSFLVQGIGGSLLSPGNDANVVDIGLKIYMSGMGLQEAFIVLFTLLGVGFQIDMQKVEAGGQGRQGRRGWKGQMYVMYAVLALITMRIIFRLVEFTRGTDADNPMLHNEEFVYVLDATPMFFAIFLLNVFHPGRVLVGPDSEFPRLSRKEKKALKREKKEEKKRRKEEKKYGKKKQRISSRVEEYDLRELHREERARE